MYLVVTRVPGESYRRRLTSLLLCLCYVFRALIKSLCVLILHLRSEPRSVSDHAVPLVAGLVVVFVLRLSRAD